MIHGTANLGGFGRRWEAGAKGKLVGSHQATDGVLNCLSVAVCKIRQARSSVFYGQLPYRMR